MADPAATLMALVAEMRSSAMVAGQYSVEAPNDAESLMAFSEADRISGWADQIEAALQAAPARETPEPLLSKAEVLAVWDTWRYNDLKHQFSGFIHSEGVAFTKRLDEAYADKLPTEATP